MPWNWPELSSEKDIPKDISRLAEERLKAKEAKDWDKADKLRKEIEAKGYRLIDTKDGFEIKKTS